MARLDCVELIKTNLSPTEICSFQLLSFFNSLLNCFPVYVTKLSKIYSNNKISDEKIPATKNSPRYESCLSWVIYFLSHPNNYICINIGKNYKTDIKYANRPILLNLYNLFALRQL